MSKAPIKKIEAAETVAEGVVLMPQTEVVRAAPSNPRIEHALEVVEGTHTSTDTGAVQGLPSVTRDAEVEAVENNGIALEVTRY